MEKREPFEIFDFFVEHKRNIGYAAFALFIVISTPTKASIFIGILFVLLGEAVRSLSISERQGVERLVTTGVYGYVRNPDYLGTFLIGAGVFIMGNIFIFTALFVIICLALFSERIKMKEEQMREVYGDDFEDYAFNVPALMPRFTPLEDDNKLRFDPEVLTGQKEYHVWLMIYAITILMFLQT